MTRYFVPDGTRAAMKIADSIESTALAKSGRAGHMVAYDDKAMPSHLEMVGRSSRSPAEAVELVKRILRLKDAKRRLGNAISSAVAGHGAA